MSNHIITNLGPLRQPQIRGKVFTYGVPTIVQDRPTILEAQRRGYQDVISGGHDVTPSSYVTGAVQLDANTSINIAAMLSPDSRYLAWSSWFKLRASNPGLIPSINGGLFVVDPHNAGGIIPNFQTNITNYPTGPVDLAGSWYNADASSELDWETPAPSAEEWHHEIVGLDFGVSPPVVSIYVDGVDVTNIQFAGGDPSVMVFNGLPAAFGHWGTYGYPMDRADIWFAPGQNILLEGGNDIPDSLIAKFRDPGTGKPVSLGADGSLPTGTAPEGFFRLAPGADPLTFAINLGAGGAAAWSGTDSSGQYAATLHGDQTAGDTVLYLAANFNNIAVGQPVSGPGLPSGAAVTDTSNGAHITVSHALTSNEPAGTVYVFGGVPTTASSSPSD